MSRKRRKIANASSSFSQNFKYNFYYTFLCVLLVQFIPLQLINNFKMKEKTERQKNKQKHELIFKYVKSLNPFNNPESEQYLQKLRSSKNNGERDSDSFLINSKVYEVNVAASKHKKRVSFADVEPIIEEKLSKKQKKGVKNGSRIEIQARQQFICSPERVQNDLMDLQKSVFTTFKIKHELKPDYHGNTNSIGSTKTLSYDYRNYQTVPASSSQSIIPRAKSCSSITHLGLQSTVKQKTNQTTITKLVDSSKSAGLSRSQSLTDNSLPISRIQSQISNRSVIYSKQSHNLMVEIFKQKLQTKRNN